MKSILLFATLTVFSVALLGDGGTHTITGTCQSGGDPYYPQCVSGEVTFVGTNYSDQVKVRVTNSAGSVLDSGSYSTAADGTVTFTENLSFPDTYSVKIGDDDSAIVVTVVTY